MILPLTASTPCNKPSTDYLHSSSSRPTLSYLLFNNQPISDSSPLRILSPPTPPHIYYTINSFNKYTQIASRAVRQGLKESERVGAEKRAVIGVKYQLWKDGQPGDQVSVGRPICFCFWLVLVRVVAFLPSKRGSRDKRYEEPETLLVGTSRQECDGNHRRKGT